MSLVGRHDRRPHANYHDWLDCVLLFGTRSADHIRASSHSGRMFIPLFNHLVGAGEYRWRNLEAEYLGGLQVDDKLEPSRPHNW